MPACRTSLRHDPYPEGIRSTYDAAIYDGKTAAAAYVPLHHVMRYPEHEHASGALDYIHAPHALTHVR